MANPILDIKNYHGPFHDVAVFSLKNYVPYGDRTIIAGAHDLVGYR